jgi:hypothetical protein
MMAVLSLVGPPRWRSRQLKETFSFAPSNHLISGFRKSYRNTLSHFLDQVMFSAILAQKPSGSRSDSSYILSNSSGLFTYAFS